MMRIKLIENEPLLFIKLGILLACTNVQTGANQGNYLQIVLTRICSHATYGTSGDSYNIIIFIKTFVYENYDVVTN